VADQRDHVEGRRRSEHEAIRGLVDQTSVAERVKLSDAELARRRAQRTA
jgi:hypothetical protein